MLNLVEATTQEILCVAGTTQFNNAVLPARRYRNTISITFKDLYEQLGYCHRIVRSKIYIWKIRMQKNGIQVQKGMSRRPIGEIVMRAMLCTRRPFNITEATSSLGESYRCVRVGVDLLIRNHGSVSAIDPTTNLDPVT